MMCHPKYFVNSLLVSYFVLTAGIPIVSARTTTRPADASQTTTPLNLSPPVRTGLQDCYENGINGSCYLQKYCTADKIVPIYGLPGPTELREKGCPSGYWCCVLEQEIDSEEVTDPPATNQNTGKEKEKETKPEQQTKPPVTNNAGTGNGANNAACTPVDTDCPWCVSIHKGTPKDMFETGLYCMGSMIGPNIVLTSGSCVLAAEYTNQLWVQVPGSVKPKQKYSVKEKKRHPEYDTGSHEFDYGLMILDDNVNWGTKKWIGACLGLKKAVTGECIGFGFDAKERIVSTLLTTKPGGCTERGNTTDVSCASKFANEKYCIIAQGSPVSCAGSADVRGVARSECSDDTALAGSLSFAKDWIIAELTKLNVSPNSYLINSA